MKKLIERKFYLGQLKRLKDQHIIKVITGLRRSGKSTLLTMFAQQIINSGVSTSRVHQYNFEKPLFPETHTWRDIYQEIMAKVVTDNMNYIFLDEPQQVPEFERLIDALFVENHIDLYVTGSNAYFLSGDIATLLSGRYITIHVLPFSFAEFVESQEETTATKYELFNRYLNETSLPQGVFLYKQGIDIQNQYILDVYNTVVEKDIRQRYNIQNMRSFDNLSMFLMGAIGSTVSPSSISKAMKQDLQNIHHKTVQTYIDYLVNSFVFYPAHRFDIKGKQQLATQEKYYLVDLGFRNLKLGKFQYQDLGHLLENIVFLELKRRGYQIWIGKVGSYEVDFIVKNAMNSVEYYQVTWSISDPITAEREIRPLKAIADNYPKHIISTDMITAEIDGIKHRNIVDWLLDP
ncbi:MAG: ATP-binding protein [Myxococcota bacterium]|jgi:predicted AAA+ superfamily ATPase|nr:ATP-binding protein [Myxococcota bacterium]MBP8971530.1 ATP-binding protein [Myxococcota bacterium]HHW95654.1 ATP-binding protein [Oligoflexales bacterium]HQC44664.1 ATP-binding protein [Myxococcota bacterium]HQL57133.1 ATP-binding protein [Myxococcota bacterium]